MKIALCLSSDVAIATRTVSAMLEAQRHEPNCETQILSFAFGSVGLLGRPSEDISDWPFWQGPDGSFLLFTGVPILSNGSNPSALTGTNPMVAGALAPGDAARTLHALGDVDGAFTCIWWSASRGELSVVTDCLGMQPLYRAESGGRTYFASEIKAFTRAGVLPIEADAGAWAAMLYFGHQVGERSMLSGATRVPPATAITFTSPSNANSRATWQWPVRGDQRHRTLVDDIGEALRADIRAYATVQPDAALLLSGGFDSRLIFCLCSELGIKPRLLTQSHPDENADADARFGEAFARLRGMSTKRFGARADYYSTDDYLRYLTLNEVGTPSLSLFIASVTPVVRPERNGIWEGLLLDPALKFEYGSGGFGPYLESRLAGTRRNFGGAVQAIFRAPWAERMNAEFDSLLAAERARFPDDADGVWRFSVLNRTRFRQALNPYQVYDSTTLPLTPGMSRRFWELSAAVEPETRFNKRFYRDVFARLAPQGLAGPLASGTVLIKGDGGTLLYHTQRLRMEMQKLARRPKVHRQLRAWGLPTPFSWEPSRFLDVPEDQADLDDLRVNADWVRQQARRGGAPQSNDAAHQAFMYWRAWHQVMRGDLVSSWGDGAGT